RCDLSARDRAAVTYAARFQDSQLRAQLVPVRRSGLASGSLGGSSPSARSAGGAARMSAPAAWMVLFRHGHSEWNLSDRFTGWTDIPLTDVGLAEAAGAGRRLAQAGYAFDEVHGSVLQRTR